MFQSTLPRGERRALRDARRRTADVSIHAPARGATTSGSRSPAGRSSFNPRSRAGSDRTADTESRIQHVFQSTLPRGERPAAHHGHHLCPTVSIHAPARGATAVIGEAREEKEVSIHAPARGATVQERAVIRRVSCFNPRSRAGSDPDTIVRIVYEDEFQSTLPRGERPDAAAGFVGRQWFQSTLPRGERRAEQRYLRVVAKVSIHAPARGATGRLMRSERKGPVSIHAPARGATWRSWT